MKKIVSTLYLAIFFTLFNTHVVFADDHSFNHRKHFDSFDDFYQSLPVLSMPIDNNNTANGIYVDSKFFHFDDDDYSYYDKPIVETDNYYTLKNLKAIGRFEMGDIKFILYDYTFAFDSLGEGFNEDNKLINAFDKNGKYLDELMVAGKDRHEDHIFYFSSMIKDQLFHIKLDSVYDDEDKTTIDLTYQFRDNQFWLKKPPVDCQTVNLQQYLNKLTEQEFADIDDIVAFSDYIDCYPISDNLQTYKQIAEYINNARSYFLSSAELKKLHETIRIIEE